MGRENTSTPGRGETFFEGTIPADAATNAIYNNYAGATKVFEDKLWGNKGVKPDRVPNREIVCRLVRNMSGIQIYASRLVQLDPTNPNNVLGYATTLAQEAYPVDEFLPAAGVSPNDFFWIVIKGPAMVLLPLAGAEFQTTSINAGDVLCAGTFSAASTAAGSTQDVGRISGFSIVAATTIAQFQSFFNYTQNSLGRAMSGATSGQTSGVSILVDINRDHAGWP